MTTATDWNLTNKQRVDAGMKMLDSKEPDWYRNISTDVLDLMSTQACVLGQLYGSYGAGQAKLNLSEADLEMLGFNGDTPTAPWRRAIQERQRK